jgi:hypothetical protein
MLPLACIPQRGTGDVSWLPKGAGVDTYHIWADLKDGVKDLVFVGHVERYMKHLQEQGAIAGFRISRRKLGLGPASLGEFHIAIDVRDLAQLDQAFNQAAARAGTVESYHSAVYASVRNTTFALYRDFPDPVRQRS